MRIVAFILLFSQSFLVSAQDELTKLDSIESLTIIDSIIKELGMENNYKIKIDTIYNISYSLSRLKWKYEGWQESVKYLEKNEEPPNVIEYRVKKLLQDSLYINHFEKQMLSPQKLWDIDLKKMGVKKAKRKQKIYYRISTPVFNKDRSLALVTHGQVCPGLCGSIAVKLLRKIENKWVEEVRFMALI